MSKKTLPIPGTGVDVSPGLLSEALYHAPLEIFAPSDKVTGIYEVDRSQKSREFAFFGEMFRFYLVFNHADSQLVDTSEHSPDFWKQFFSSLHCDVSLIEGDGRRFDTIGRSHFHLGPDVISPRQMSCTGASPCPDLKTFAENVLNTHTNGKICSNGLSSWTNEVCHVDDEVIVYSFAIKVDIPRENCNLVVRILPSAWMLEWERDLAQAEESIPVVRHIFMPLKIFSPLSMAFTSHRSDEDVFVCLNAHKSQEEGVDIVVLRTCINVVKIPLKTADFPERSASQRYVEELDKRGQVEFSSDNQPRSPPSPTELPIIISTDPQKRIAPPPPPRSRKPYTPEPTIPPRSESQQASPRASPLRVRSAGQQISAEKSPLVLAVKQKLRGSPFKKKNVENRGREEEEDKGDSFDVSRVMEGLSLYNNTDFNPAKPILPYLVLDDANVISASFVKPVTLSFDHNFLFRVYGNFAEVIDERPHRALSVSSEPGIPSEYDRPDRRSSVLSVTPFSGNNNNINTPKIVDQRNQSNLVDLAVEVLWVSSLNTVPVLSTFQAPWRLPATSLLSVKLFVSEEKVVVGKVFDVEAVLLNKGDTVLDGLNLEVISSTDSTVLSVNRTHRIGRIESHGSTVTVMPFIVSSSGLHMIASELLLTEQGTERAWRAVQRDGDELVVFAEKE